MEACIICRKQICKISRWTSLQYILNTENGESEHLLTILVFVSLIYYSKCKDLRAYNPGVNFDVGVVVVLHHTTKVLEVGYSLDGIIRRELDGLRQLVAL